MEILAICKTETLATALVQLLHDGTRHEVDGPLALLRINAMCMRFLHDAALEVSPVPHWHFHSSEVGQYITSAVLQVMPKEAGVDLLPLSRLLGIAAAQTLSGQ